MCQEIECKDYDINSNQNELELLASKLCVKRDEESEYIKNFDLLSKPR
jgi:hypothetical protein